jgi:hypothetical protein
MGYRFSLSIGFPQLDASRRFPQGRRQGPRLPDRSGHRGRFRCRKGGHRYHHCCHGYVELLLRLQLWVKLTPYLFHLAGEEQAITFKETAA